MCVEIVLQHPANSLTVAVDKQGFPAVSSSDGGGGLEGGIDTVTYRDFFVVDF